MRRRLALACVLAVVVCSPVVVLDTVGPEEASAGSATGAGATRTDAVPEVTEPVDPDERAAEVADAVTDSEDASGESTNIGIAVLDRETGELEVGENGDQLFYLASLAKLVLAVDIFDRRRAEGLVVTDAALDQLRRALGPSDDQAMNLLWGAFDGPTAAGRVSERLGISGLEDPDDWTQWGEMRGSAAAIVSVWDHVLSAWPADDRDLLLADVRAAPAEAADGFPQAFGLLAPQVREAAGAETYAKQGWLCCFGQRYYLHSAGVVARGAGFVVAVLATLPRGQGWDVALAALTADVVVLVNALPE